MSQELASLPPSGASFPINLVPIVPILNKLFNVSFLLLVSFRASMRILTDKVFVTVINTRRVHRTAVWYPFPTRTSG